MSDAGRPTPTRTGMPSNFGSIAAELSREAEIRARSGTPMRVVEDTLRVRAENELRGLEQLEELYVDATEHGDEILAARIREKVFSEDGGLCDLDRYPDALFEAMCLLKAERDQRLLEQLRTTPPERYALLTPDWLQRRMSEPTARVRLLTHLSLGIPFWQGEGLPKRTLVKHDLARAAQAEDATAESYADQLAKGGGRRSRR